MALEYGRQPTNGRSRLTGLPDAIYKKIEANILPDTLKGIDTSVKNGVMSGREGEKNKDHIKFQHKKLAYDIASSIIDYLKENMEFEIKGTSDSETPKITTQTWIPSPGFWTENVDKRIKPQVLTKEQIEIK